MSTQQGANLILTYFSIHFLTVGHQSIYFIHLDGEKNSKTVRIFQDYPC
jgi:hypothetical protein